MAERCRYCERVLSRSNPEHVRHWPFCGERCEMAELGLWFEERYVISRPLGQVADDAAVGEADASVESPPEGAAGPTEDDPAAE